MGEFVNTRLRVADQTLDKPVRGRDVRIAPLIDWLEANAGMSWRNDALCAQTDPEAFFPGKGGSTQEAKRVCADCSVRKQCLDWAVEHDERFGIWGGMSERERRRYKKSLRKG